MTCPSPQVDLPSRGRRQVDKKEIPEPVILGFIMDGADLRTWSEDNNVTFHYFEDPVYSPLDDNETEVLSGGSLKIKVSRSWDS